jgi:hypothetical protein
MKFHSRYLENSIQEWIPGIIARFSRVIWYIIMQIDKDSDVYTSHSAYNHIR